MRCWWGVFAVTAVLLVALTGCSRVIAGVAQKDPTRPGLTLSEGRVRPQDEPLLSHNLDVIRNGRSQRLKERQIS
jgi:hypothetical protein